MPLIFKIPLECQKLKSEMGKLEKKQESFISKLIRKYNGKKDGQIWENFKNYLDTQSRDLRINQDKYYGKSLTIILTPIIKETKETIIKAMKKRGKNDANVKKMKKGVAGIYNELCKNKNIFKICELLSCGRYLGKKSIIGKGSAWDKKICELFYDIFCCINDNITFYHGIELIIKSTKEFLEKNNNKVNIPKEAKEFFELLQIAKENPTFDNKEQLKEELKSLTEKYKEEMHMDHYKDEAKLKIGELIDDLDKKFGIIQVKKLETVKKASEEEENKEE